MIVTLKFFKVYENRYKFVCIKLVNGLATYKVGYKISITITL